MARGRHLVQPEADPFDPENPILEPSMKWIGWPAAEISPPVATWTFQDGEARPTYTGLSSHL